MQWIAMIFPSFVSVILSENLEKKKYSGVEFVERAGVYALFTNLITVVVYQYILKTPASILGSFENNLFLIHYMCINIFFAVLLPILKLAVNPYLHISVEKRGRNEKEEPNSNEEKAA